MQLYQILKLLSAMRTANTQAALLQKVSQWEPEDARLNCLVKLSALLEKIVQNPGEQKYLTLNLDNAALQSSVLSVPGAQEFLESAGFRPDGTSPPPLGYTSRRLGDCGIVIEPLLIRFASQWTCALFGVNPCAFFKMRARRLHSTLARRLRLERFHNIEPSVACLVV